MLLRNIVLMGGRAKVNPPTITSLTPNYGRDVGGRNITIAGTNLANATAVTFGGVAGTIQSKTATQIVVTTPATTPGSVDVVVTNPGGASVAKKFYSYNGALGYWDPAVGMQSSGGKISRIYESMVNDGSASTAIDEAMGTGAWQPTADAGLYGGPGIYFPTGPANLALQGGGISYGAFTWAFVVYAETVDAQFLLTHWNGSNYSWLYNNAGSNQEASVNYGGTVSAKGSASAITPVGGHSVIWSYDGTDATHTLYVDDAAFSFTTHFASNDPGSAVVARSWYLGASSGVNSLWRGWVGPHMCADHAWSAAERATWKAMVKARYPSLP